MDLGLAIEHRQIATNGLTLHVVEAGPKDGPLVVLLHGFPEFWYGWRKQIAPLAAAGYRVLVPDQRGYNLSDKPTGAAAYKLDHLACDIVGLIDDAGRQRATVIGHDWGGAVAWWLGLKYPQRVERLVILNVSHGQVFLHHLHHSPRQMLRSWYILLFQLPWLPEAALRRRQWRSMARSLQTTSRPGAFSDADLDEYRQAWAQPGAATGMLNWYRAIRQQKIDLAQNPRIAAPTLLIWGAQDRFLGREMAQPSIDLCDRGRLVFLEAATHWVQHEEPDRVNDLIREFLAADAGGVERI